MLAALMMQRRFARIFLALAMVGAMGSTACSGRLASIDGGSESVSASDSGGASSAANFTPASGSVPLGPGPDCADLQAPQVACAEGPPATTEIVLQDGQCVLKFTCPAPQNVSLPGALLPAAGPSTCTAPRPEMCDQCLALPDVCQVCPDGRMECAHYILENDANAACAIEVCPPDPIIASLPTQTGPPEVDAGVTLLCGQTPVCTPNSACIDVINGCEVKCWCPTAGPWECKSACMNDP